uniref:Beta-lactamase domain-containing protein n=1 Tax=Strongyloides papillosus TaxID=174720 RepID=A0A0N5BCW0_STREA
MVLKRTLEPKFNIVGCYDEKFEKVAEVFKKNFYHGWEPLGASVAIFHQGECVADLYGGYSDTKHNLWTVETQTVVFSVSKSIGALCVALLVDNGSCSYDDKITKYWPEFGANGKENITIRHIMTHRAGLAYFDQTLTFDDAKDHNAVRKIIEKTKPNWSPGTKSGYHAITYGWLVDQIIRHIDSKKRGVSQFFAEEIAKPHGIDFYLGIPKELQSFVSELSVPTTSYRLKEIMHDPRILIVLAILNLQTHSSIGEKVKNNFDWIKIDKNEITFNYPEVQRLEQTAALGITTAKDLGFLFSKVLNGEIISKSLIKKLEKPEISNEIDIVFKAPISKGHGFMYEKHPYKKGQWLVGHPGYGGSTLMMDPKEELVVAYVTNGLKSGMGELTRTYRLLRNAALKCVLK